MKELSILMASGTTCIFGDSDGLKSTFALSLNRDDDNISCAIMFNYYHAISYYNVE
jgi:hypothetical protein